MSWDERWQQQAELAASWSKDRHRKVGAVIVDQREVLLAIGWNGLPRGVNDVEARYERPEKNLWIIHAEKNALLNAAAKGISIEGSRLYVQRYPCSACAAGIIQAGIREVITVKPDWDHPRHGKEWEVAYTMFKEARVAVRWFQPVVVNVTA